LAAAVLKALQFNSYLALQPVHEALLLIRRAYYGFVPLSAALLFG